MELAKYLFRVWFAIWPLFLGVFLPYVGVFDHTKFVNLFWGAIYGFGLFLTDWIFTNSVKSPVLIIGVFIWPVFISALLFWAAGRWWHRSSLWGRLKSVAILFLTMFLAVSISTVSQPPFNLIPTYWKLMFVVW
jgi:hypothetical protein